jgi:general secretion pathway protein K
MPRRQRGVALLVALLVVALATLVIAALLDRGQLALARSRNDLRSAQADAYARGLEAYAAEVLLKDDQGMDANDDIWAMPLPPTPVPGGEISATMTDMNGCFNLNNLVQNRQRQMVWMMRFRNLLLALKLSPDIAEATADWIDSDNDADPRGAEDGVYLAHDPPYRAANRIFTDASELRLVAGVDERAWEALAPYVCALPTATSLNVNTASIPVLMSLSSKITAPLAARLYKNGHARWQSANNLQGTGDALVELARAGVTLDQDEQQGLGVASDYFMAHAQIRLDGIDFAYRSLLQRDRGIRVLMHHQGE